MARPAVAANGLGWEVRVRESVRAVRFLAVAAALLACVPESGHAQAGRSQVQEGNKLYEQGFFPEAHEKYLEGLASAPESGLIRFNDGNALYKGEDYQRAVEAYQRAIETGDPALVGSAWYNLGNAFYRQQQLEESLQAYKEALRLRPADFDAKHNLERVLEQMKQQEQQQEDDEQNQDQQDQPQPQDQEQDEEQEQDGQQQPEEQEPPDGEGEPRPEPGQMTPQEAQRLLEAIEEDPDDVDRKRVPATGRRPLKAW